jgi:hypothetical protein
MRGTSACFLDLDLEDGVLKVWFEFSNPQNTLKIVMSAAIYLLRLGGRRIFAYLREIQRYKRYYKAMKIDTNLRLSIEIRYI